MSFGNRACQQKVSLSDICICTYQMQNAKAGSEINFFFTTSEPLGKTEGSVTEAVLVMCFVGARVTFSVKFNF